MRKILLNEKQKIVEDLKNLETKSVIIILSSTILFTVSWYLSNPKYFSKLFTFHKSFDLVYEDLTAFCAWFAFDTFLFLLIPILIISILFNDNLKNYGLVLGNRKVGITITTVSFLLFIPIIYFISISENFSQYFPLMKSATDDFSIFIIYEILFITFIFSWEFIFRGFLLFGLEAKFGIYSIFIQMMPFVLLHNGKPFIETLSSIFGAIFLGYLALRTRSIFYGFLIHASILLTLDIIAYLNV